MKPPLSEYWLFWDGKQYNCKQFAFHGGFIVEQVKSNLQDFSFTLYSFLNMIKKPIVGLLIGEINHIEHTINLAHSEYSDEYNKS